MTATLSEQLAGKQRKRLIVPIQVTDATEDHEQWMAVATALELAKQRDDTDAVSRLEEELTAVSDRYRSHWVRIELQALSANDWEMAMREWHDGDTVDWARALSPLLAQSCVDTSLRDTDQWRERLERPEWTEGDRYALRAGLLQLNTLASDPVAPKG